MMILGERLNLFFEREYSVKENIPDMLKYQSVLYVGANQTRQHFLDWFINANYNVTIVEAFKENYKYLKNNFPNCNVIHSDIRKYQPTEKFDIIFFWHGIEHLPITDIPQTLKQLESMCHIIILGMPFGEYIQGAEYGNDFEIHRSTIYPEFLQKYGYTTITIGNKDEEGSHITAWKRLSKDF